MDRIGETIGRLQSGVRTALSNQAIGNAGNRGATMPKFAIVRHWPDWVNQSGMAGSPIGGNAPVGDKDTPISYGVYSLASYT